MNVTKSMRRAGATVALLIALVSPPNAKAADVCGDGAISGSEKCDDANLRSGDCCSPTCQFQPDNAACLSAASVEKDGWGSGFSSDYSAGWEFEVHSDLTVTAVGVFDCDDDGLDQGHQVGIWDKATGMTLQATGTIPSGTVGPLVGHARYVPIPAYKLVAGHSYIFAALYPQSSTDCVVFSAEINFDPRITFVTGHEASGPGLTFPLEPVDFRFGPLFLFDSLRGNGVVDADEQCDDANVENGDGCSSNGAREFGYVCTGMPSACATLCGDGKIAGAETCDDGDASGGDGCSATCKIENDYTCKGAPSVCTNTCGNGVVDGGEFCDDENRLDDDGCSSQCAVEASYTCAGNPSFCTTQCGNGVINPLEECDDGNVAEGDCCTKTCRFVPVNAACRKSMRVPPGGTGGGGVGVVEGWELTVSSAVTVTGLGVFDDETSAGLAEEHPIAIWEGPQKMLTTATLPAGRVAPLINGFRYVPIGALTLTPGHNYTIGAYFPPPRFDWVIGAPSLPLDSRISLIQGRRLPFVDELLFPTTLGNAPQIGPGFLLEFAGCGNEALEAGEQCDDGNGLDNDCCSACHISDGEACTRGDACLGDCNRDDEAGAGEVARIGAIIASCAACADGAGAVATGCTAVSGADKQCGAADDNGDHCLTAAELTRVLAHRLSDPQKGCRESEEEED